MGHPSWHNFCFRLRPLRTFLSAVPIKTSHLSHISWIVICGFSFISFFTKSTGFAFLAETWRPGRWSSSKQSVPSLSASQASSSSTSLSSPPSSSTAVKHGPCSLTVEKKDPGLRNQVSEETSAHLLLGSTRPTTGCGARPTSLWVHRNLF